LDLRWFEPTGLKSNLAPTATDWERFGDLLWHLVLPMFVLVILSIGGWMRYTRTNTLEVLSADYIRTARAKGLSEKSVVYKHVFRNTLIPLVTMLAGTLPSLFGGAMITEQVFDLPGIGNTAYQLMLKGDIPFVMGYNMFIAILTVIGILLTDIMYAVVDPRVKLGE
jgi:peptide/nickel transport system permease protein